MITKEYQMINNKEQCLVTFSTSQENPVILYLHGGPGDSCSPLIEKFNQNLSNNYTIVVWEQRGSGLSYYKFSDGDTPVLQDYVDDARVILEYLNTKYESKSIFLMGHSWGSVLGIKCVTQFPELISSYIGIGQVVQMKETYHNQQNFINQERCKSGKKNVEIKDIDFNSKDWMKSVLNSAKEVVKYGGSLYSRSNQNYLVWPFFNSKIYRKRDLINRQMGSKQSIQMLWQELMTIDFSNLTKFSVPIYLIEGLHDEHVSANLAMEWCENIETKKNLKIFEKSGHFPQWEEPEHFNSVIHELLK
ncbi:MAG: alpha/beta hydrolase [Erysipelothrix sp.]